MNEIESKASVKNPLSVDRITPKNAEEEDDLVQSEGSKLTMESDTDQLLKELKREYEKKSNQDSKPLAQATISPVTTRPVVTRPVVTNAVVGTVDAPADRISTDVDTDALMEAITKISAKNQDQTGGKSSKHFGYTWTQGLC